MLAGTIPPVLSFPLKFKSEKIRSKKLVLTDKFGRRITDLRISITDACNYKCVYCRTGNEGALYGDLPFADYLRMARVLVGMGITKVRLTGGEPLLRKGVVDFVRELAKLRPPNGHAEPLDIALTTNGHLLADLAQQIKDARLSRYRFHGRG
jgi:cyclic pyranopterin phosphate synthase